MANINAVNFDYIKKWEGGLSKDSRDQAAKDPVPDSSGYHTNIGITWQTFKGLAAKGGYTATPELFYKMPKDIWLKIYKVGFWDVVQGDKINSQAIAELCADWVWGTGPYAIKLIQQALNKLGAYPPLPGSYVFGPQTLKNMNELIKKKGEKVVFEALFAARQKFMLDLGAKPAYAMFNTGWQNRLRDFYSFASKLVTDKPVIPIIVLAARGLGLYLAFKNGDLKKSFGVSNGKAIATAAGVV
jgi:lysozyme family protein